MKSLYRWSLEVRYPNGGSYGGYFDNLTEVIEDIEKERLRAMRSHEVISKIKIKRTKSK